MRGWFRWFLRNHADGSDYQPLVNALVDAGRVEDACWLLTQFGPTDEVLQVDAIDAEAMVFAGTLEVQGNIEVTTVLRSGRSIRADTVPDVYFVERLRYMLNGDIGIVGCRVKPIGGIPASRVIWRICMSYPRDIPRLVK